MKKTKDKHDDGAATLTGTQVEARDGSKLGKLVHVYRSRATDEPTWGVVRTGRVRRTQHVVPLEGESPSDGALRLPVDKRHVERAPKVDTGDGLAPEAESTLSDHYRGAQQASVEREHRSETHRVQQEQYGGARFSVAFFGWLVAVALTVLLVALVGAIATAVGFSVDLGRSEAASQAATIGIAGGIVLLVVLMIAYAAGGYVAGRMARFDGARQGAFVWLLGIIVSVLLVVAGALFGSEYNLLQQVNVPTVPVPTDSLTVGGLVALVAIVVGTLLAAMAGGKAGERFHRKVDRVAEA